MVDIVKSTKLNLKTFSLDQKIWDTKYKRMTKRKVWYV